ncbi:MAG: methylenetetrahydrofolate reductase [NAD(P)H] [Candidatus Gastranaerophilaceae bacterium]
MTLREIYSPKNNRIISFEIFPPKDDSDGVKLSKLLKNLEVLKKHNPAFISLTYGAGGTTQNTSLEIIKKIQKDLKLAVMPHFTCVGNSKNEVKNYLNEIQDLGIKNILALRGDIPENTDLKTMDFKHANELVEFIKSESSLSIGVAGYPEGHIESDNLLLDLKNLKRKVDAGADVIYTQMFFDNDKFFNFVRLAMDAGIEIPIIPGILPVMSYPQLEKMLSMARVTVPKAFMEKLERYKESPEDIKKIGVEFATCQCQKLIDAKVSGLHFFTLNKSHSLSQILDNLGVYSVSQNRV